MEYILQRGYFAFPHTLLGYGTEIIVGIAVAVFFGSFVEHIVHRYVMHLGLPLPNKKHLAPEQQYRHATLHHGTYYKHFDNESDREGREISLAFTAKDMLMFQLGLLPFLIIIAIVSPIVTICTSVVALTHNFLWNLFHRQMHQPKNVFWVKWALYRFLARYHFLHHQHTNTNFNVVFPFADNVFGTRAIANAEDIEEMRRLGYFLIG